MSDTTVTVDPPLPNSPEARTPSGELKNQAPTTTPTSSPTPSETPTETPPPEEAKAAPAAPEKYDDFKLPEGVKLEGDSLKSAQDLFKGLNLPQESAQKLVDFHVAQLKASSESSSRAYEDMRADWQARTKADPDLGPKLPQIKETVGRALDSLGDAKLVADFRQAMDITGAGDHPAFVKAFYKLAQSVTEGRHVSGQNPSQFGQIKPGTDGKPTVAQALYPNNP